MRHPRSFDTLLALGALALAACGPDVTEPSNQPQQPGSPNSPTLAVAHDTWLTRRDMQFESRWPTTAVVPVGGGQSILYAIGGRGPGQSPDGHYSPVVTLDRVQAYNVATNTWSQKARVPRRMFYTNGTGVLNGKIYISGGLYLDEDTQAGEPSRSLFAYDPATNSWTQLAYMPEAGAGGVTGVINGKLYVVSTCYERVPDEYYEDTCGSVEGGRPGVSNFFRYNPSVDRWTRLPSPRGEYHMGGVLYDKLYLTDGKTIEVYDRVTNQWTTKVTGGQLRREGAATVQGAMLYLTGGFQLGADGWQPVRTNRVYHPITNTWTTAAPLPTARYGMAAIRVFLNGRPRIELVGGSAPGNNLQYIP